MELGWLERALIATIFFVPIMLSTGILKNNFGIRPEATIIWYSLGQVITAPILLHYFGVLDWQNLAPSKPLLFVLLLGMTCGVVSNILFFQTLSMAPNPGFPMAITNSAAIIVFLLSALLTYIFPRYFIAAKFDLWHLLGIVLAVIGMSIIVIKQ